MKRKVKNDQAEEQFIGATRFLVLEVVPSEYKEEKQ